MTVYLAHIKSLLIFTMSVYKNMQRILYIFKSNKIETKQEFNALEPGSRCKDIKSKLRWIEPIIVGPFILVNVKTQEEQKSKCSLVMDYYW